MVHALLECWRALAPGGYLIDLRPYSSNPAIELVVEDGQTIVPGHINDESGVPLDVAADEAIAEVVRRGLFRLDQEAAFKFNYYWPALEDMVEYVSVRWADFAFIPAFVLEEARQIVAELDGRYRVRVSNNMYGRAYQKVVETKVAR